MGNIKPTEANSKEIRAYEYISCLELRLDKNGKDLEKRMKSVPDIWRQYRIAQTATTKVVDGLRDTFEPRVLLRLANIAANGEVVIRPISPLNKSTDSQVILSKDLSVLINTSMASQCAVCMKKGKEVKNCELRKVLMNVSPPNRLEENKMSMCVFTEVAVTHELGQYI